MSTQNYVPPSQYNYLRACMVCSIVRTFAQFRSGGCPNCEDFLHLAGAPEAVEQCTSEVFEGVMTFDDPSTSWTAKWQRLDTYVSGNYALKVLGQLPDDVRDSMDEHGLVYIP